MAFLEFKSEHDPSGQSSGPWTFLILLDDGDSLTNGTVTVVDGDDVPIPAPDITVSNVTFGSIANPGQSNLWGVSFFLQNGTPQLYSIRCRYTTSHSPVVGGDITMRLRCKQT